MDASGACRLRRKAGTVRYLLSQGVNADSGEALQIAALHGDMEIVKYLYDAGADVNLPADSTPLDFAEMNEHTEVADYLRSVGAKRSTELGRSFEQGSFPAHLVESLGDIGPVSFRQVVPDHDISLMVHLVFSESGASLVSDGLSAEVTDASSGSAVEFAIHLDEEWPFNEMTSDVIAGWPLLNLFRWAEQLFSVHGSQISGEAPFTVCLTDPPEPAGPGVRFTHWLIYHETVSFATFESEDREIRVFTMTPIYPEEAKLAKTAGAQELLQRLAKASALNELDVDRSSVVPD